MKGIALNLIVLGLLVHGIEFDAEWAINIFKAMIWLLFAAGLLSLIVPADKMDRPKTKNKVSKFVCSCIRTVCILACFGLGWFVTGIAYVVFWLILYVKSEAVRVHYEELDAAVAASDQT